MRFVLITIIGSNVIAFGFSWLTYFIARDANYSLCVKHLDTDRKVVLTRI